MSAAIETRAATKRFGDFVAVDAVDLSVQPGEVVALLGANGAGKTTLMKMILGLLVPSSGTVHVFGGPADRDRRRRIGYVPQNLGLYPDLTVVENLEFRERVYGSQAPKRAPADATTLVGDLPLGLQRRAAFDAALAHRPELLVLDEPTSGVSPLARSALWALIRERAEAGIAVLVSTHYMDEADQADRVVLMAAGRVVATGTTADVIAGREVVEVRAERWADAFTVLDHGGRLLVLAGRAVRVLATPMAAVRAELDAAGIAADVVAVPASLEEAMVSMSTAAEP